MGGGLTRESDETVEVFTAQATAGASLTLHLPVNGSMDADGHSACRERYMIGKDSTLPGVLYNNVEALLPTGHMNARWTDSLNSNQW